MPEVLSSGDGTPVVSQPGLPAALDGMPARASAEGDQPDAVAVPHVGWGFIALYTLAYVSTSLLFLAPLLVTLALKVNSLVGTERAPNSLSLVAGVGSLLAIFANPFFGKPSDRTSASWGRRRPWIVVGLLGGSVGVLGVCVPIASVTGTFLVTLFTGQLAMFLMPCVIGGFFILLFAATLDDRRLATADKQPWSLRELASTFYINPRKAPDFAWAFASRFLFLLAYAFLATYQTYYLLDKIGTAEGDVPGQVFLGTLVQSAVVVVASLLGGRLSDRTGRRKIFVLAASTVYGVAMFVIAFSNDFNGFLVGMAIGGLGFGVYVAVDLALATDVLPDRANAAKDLGVFNIAGALPFSLAPAIAPAILAIAGGSYGVLYAVAGVSALLGAAAILPVKGVR